MDKRQQNYLQLTKIQSYGGYKEEEKTKTYQFTWTTSLYKLTTLNIWELL